MKRLAAGDAVLCAGTLAAVPLAERLAAAAAAGFAGVSLFVTDYFRARAEGVSDADLRALLARHDLAVAEIDPLLRWVPGATLPAWADASGDAFFAHGEADFFATAEALQARSINVALVAGGVVPGDAVVAAFAGLCDRAAERGLLVHLEFLPWTQIANLPAALDVVERAGRANGGVTLDAWHHFRSGGDAASLAAAPGERILAVQLSDAPMRPEADLVAETTRRRLLPGAGELDLVGLVRALAKIGSPAPLGVEVFSEALAARPAAEVARGAGDALRSLREQAGV